jgi:hypothetical protein
MNIKGYARRTDLARFKPNPKGPEERPILRKRFANSKHRGRCAGAFGLSAHGKAKHVKR